MTCSTLCTVKLFVNDTENVKNFCKVEVEPNSILPIAYHIIDGLWFIATQKSPMFNIVCLQKQKETDCKSIFRYNQDEHVLYSYK